MHPMIQRIDTRRTWMDLFLPKEQINLLHQITDKISIQASHSGVKEFSVLFIGESATGKTMAAEVLANELHLPLFRIDLYQVVSKYIGETETNLRQVFDAAETSGALLFFDEADALFSKRSEVKDSHDRYENIEINSFLQYINNYRGLVILSVKKVLHPSILPKFSYIVKFPEQKSPNRKRRHLS